MSVTVAEQTQTQIRTVYELSYDVVNPSADENHKDLFHAATIPAGTRFVEIETEISSKLVCLSNGHFVKDNALKNALSRHLVRVEETAGSVINSNNWTPKAILAKMFHDGKISLDDIKATIQQLDSMKLNDFQHMLESHNL